MVTIYSICIILIYKKIHFKSANVDVHLLVRPLLILVFGSIFNRSPIRPQTLNNPFWLSIN
jgi:hypothetical protein